MTNLILAKKSLSQNFLVNPGMQTKVVASMKEIFELNPSLPILEIGPGAGDLTKYIIDFGAELKALEIDTRAVQVLNQKFHQISNLEIIQADALAEINKPKISPNFQEFTLLSNLPFNVGSRILVDLPIYYPKTNFAVILQAEVAQKTSLLHSKPTFFGAWLNLFWDTKIKFKIKPQNFSPAPKVDCAILTGISRNLELKKWLDSPEKRLLAKTILKSLFLSPRKSLSNNLKAASFTTEEINAFFKKTQLDPKTRLEWSNYQDILKNLVQFKLY